MFSFKEQIEEISDLEYNPDFSYLLATSIDGTLGVYDIRKTEKYKLYALSDNIEDEMYCIKLVKNGKKVACGTSEGAIVLFNWDWFGDYKDRIMGHPGSVNCIEKYDENILISGCEDGGIRFVSVYPKYVHSIISDKNTTSLANSSFRDINCVSLSHDKQYLSVSTHINYIKLYDISGINLKRKGENGNKDEEESDNEVDEEEEENGDNEEEENEAEELEEIKELLNDDEEEEEISEGEMFNEEEKSDNDGDDGKQPDDEQDKFSDNDLEEGNSSLSGEMEDGVQEVKDEVQEVEDEPQQEEHESFSDDSSDKKKLQKKADNSIKLKALGKKRTSDWMIEKERRKDFFSDI